MTKHSWLANARIVEPDHFRRFSAWFRREKSRSGFQQLVGIAQLLILSIQGSDLCHKVLRQPFSNASLTSSGLASIVSLCATRRPGVVPRSCGLPAWICSPPGYGRPRGGPHGTSHPDQIVSACSKIFPFTQTDKTWGTSTPTNRWKTVAQTRRLQSWPGLA